MIDGSFHPLASVRTADLGPSAHEDGVRRVEEPTVEVVRSLDPRSKLRADTDILRSEPTTQSLRLDIRV